MIVKLHESHRQTMRIGVLFTIVGSALFHQIGRPRLEW
jgi:hypothetical protein